MLIVWVCGFDLPFVGHERLRQLFLGKEDASLTKDLRRLVLVPFFTALELSRNLSELILIPFLKKRVVVDFRCKDPFIDFDETV